MAICETCGNDYDKAFQVIFDGKPHVFDSFECAIQQLAPTCGHCNCRIIGHGVEAGENVYCCANCARNDNETGLRDRSASGEAIAA
jgi:phage terminase large subunit GpA-like protein